MANSPKSDEPPKAWISRNWGWLVLASILLICFCCVIFALWNRAIFATYSNPESAKLSQTQRFSDQFLNYVADPNALSGFGGVLVGCVGAYIAWQISRIEQKAQQRERLYKFDNEPASVDKIDVLRKSWKKGGELDQIAEEAEDCFAKTCQKEHRIVLQLIHQYLDNESELANLLRDICKALSASNSDDSRKLSQNLESIKSALERTQRQIEEHESKRIWESVLEIVREYRDDAHRILPEVKEITITVIKFLCSKNCQLNTQPFRGALEGIPELALDGDFLTRCGLIELIEGFNPRHDATSLKPTAYSGRESIPPRDDLIETWVNDPTSLLSKNPFGWGSLSDDELFDPTFKLPSFVVFDSTRPKKELNKEFIREQKGATICGGQLQDRIFVARMLQLGWLENRFVVFCIFPPTENLAFSTFTVLLYEIAQSCAETWLSFLAKYPKELFGLSKSDSENVLQLIFWYENSSERRIERMMRYGFDVSSSIHSEELFKRMHGAHSGNSESIDPSAPPDMATLQTWIKLCPKTCEKVHILAIFDKTNWTTWADKLIILRENTRNDRPTVLNNDVGLTLLLPARYEQIYSFSFQWESKDLVAMLSDRIRRSNTNGVEELSDLSDDSAGFTQFDEKLVDQSKGSLWEMLKLGNEIMRLQAERYPKQNRFSPEILAEVLK